MFHRKLPVRKEKPPDPLLLGTKSLAVLSDDQGKGTRREIEALPFSDFLSSAREESKFLQTSTIRGRWGPDSIRLESISSQDSQPAQRESFTTTPASILLQQACLRPSGAENFLPNFKTLRKFFPNASFVPQDSTPDKLFIGIKSLQFVESGKSAKLAHKLRAASHLDIRDREKFS